MAFTWHPGGRCSDVASQHLKVDSVIALPAQQRRRREDQPRVESRLLEAFLWEEGLVSVDPLVVDVDAVAGGLCGREEVGTLREGVGNGEVC